MQNVRYSTQPRHFIIGAVIFLMLSSLVSCQSTSKAPKASEDNLTALDIQQCSTYEVSYRQDPKKNFLTEKYFEIEEEFEETSDLEEIDTLNKTWHEELYELSNNWLPSFYNQLSKIEFKEASDEPSEDQFLFMVTTQSLDYEKSIYYFYSNTLKIVRSGSRILLTCDDQNYRSLCDEFLRFIDSYTLIDEQYTEKLVELSNQYIEENNN